MFKNNTTKKVPIVKPYWVLSVGYGQEILNHKNGQTTDSIILHANPVLREYKYDDCTDHEQLESRRICECFYVVVSLLLYWTETNKNATGAVAKRKKNHYIYSIYINIYVIQKQYYTCPSAAHTTSSEQIEQRSGCLSVTVQEALLNTKHEKL